MLTAKSFCEFRVLGGRMQAGEVPGVRNRKPQALRGRLGHQFKNRVNIDASLSLHSAKIFLADLRRYVALHHHHCSERLRR